MTYCYLLILTTLQYLNNITNTEHCTCCYHVEHFHDHSTAAKIADPQQTIHTAYNVCVGNYTAGTHHMHQGSSACTHILVSIFYTHAYHDH